MNFDQFIKNIIIPWRRDWNELRYRKRENKKCNSSMHRPNLFFNEFKLVDAVSFLASLVQPYTSGSKTVSVVNGKITPDGSLNQWMRQVGADPLESPDGDIDGFFDKIGDALSKCIV